MNKAEYIERFVKSVEIRDTKIATAKKDYENSVKLSEDLFINTNAKYFVGEIVRLKNINTYIKIDERSVDFYVGLCGDPDKVVITYLGLSYKKTVDGFVRTKNMRVHRFSEDSIFLIKNPNNE